MQSLDDYKRQYRQAQDVSDGIFVAKSITECDRCHVEDILCILDETTWGEGDFSYCPVCWEYIGNRAAAKINEQLYPDLT